MEPLLSLIDFGVIRLSSSRVSGLEHEDRASMPLGISQTSVRRRAMGSLGGSDTYGAGQTGAARVRRQPLAVHGGQPTLPSVIQGSQGVRYGITGESFTLIGVVARKGNLTDPPA